MSETRARVLIDMDGTMVDFDVAALRDVPRELWVPLFQGVLAAKTERVGVMFSSGGSTWRLFLWQPQHFGS